MVTIFINNNILYEYVNITQLFLLSHNARRIATQRESGKGREGEHPGVHTHTACLVTPTPHDESGSHRAVSAETKPQTVTQALQQTRHLPSACRNHTPTHYRHVHARSGAADVSEHSSTRIEKPTLDIPSRIRHLQTRSAQSKRMQGMIMRNPPTSHACNAHACTGHVRHVLGLGARGFWASVRPVA